MADIFGIIQDDLFIACKNLFQHGNDIVQKIPHIQKVFFDGECKFRVLIVQVKTEIQIVPKTGYDIGRRISVSGCTLFNVLRTLFFNRLF